MSAWLSGNDPLTLPFETVPEISSRPFRRFLVVTALRDEAVTFCRGAGPSFYPLSLARLEKGRTGRLWRRNDLHPVVYSGPGSNGLENLDGLFSGEEVGPVLFCGFAGGISPLLEAGDILVATRVMKSGEGIVPVSPPDFLSSCYRTGMIVSSGDPVSSPSEKSRFLIETGGDVVDMESAEWLLCASRHGVPAWVVRVVSDAAGEALPPEMMTFVDAQGETSLRGIVKTFLFRPSVIPSIVGLVSGMVRAHLRLRELGRVVAAHISDVQRPEGVSR